MKKALTIVFLFIVGKSLFACEFKTSSDTIKVGDFAFGGIVFMVDPPGLHGLVCSKTDQAKGIHWNDGMNNIIEVQTDDKGAGSLKSARNDDQIKNANTSDNLANRVCKDFSVKEAGVIYNDWHLPSREELYLIYVNKDLIDSIANANGGSRFEVNTELSPTEYCNSPAWDQIFNYAYRNYDYKKSAFNVRAIRNF
jgi:hypothetical protein